MTPQEAEALALASIQRHIAAGHPLIMAMRPFAEIGSLLDYLHWSYDSTGAIARVYQPCRIVREVSFDEFMTHLPQWAQGWETGPGDFHFYEIESD
jgi:hypothetical protein